MEIQQAPIQQQAPPPATFTLDPRTIETIKWSAIWYAVARGIESIFAALSIYFMGGIAGELLRAYGGSFFDSIQIKELIYDIIGGAISGAIGGFLLSRYYTKIKEINQKYLKSKLNTLFKLLFYPSAIGALIFLLLTGGIFGAFGMGMGPSLMIAAGIIISSFIYAKMLSKKIGEQYDSPISGMPPIAPAAPTPTPTINDQAPTQTPPTVYTTPPVEPPVTPPTA